jgi:tetratricopeptide (TPR) repeat protein
MSCVLAQGGGFRSPYQQAAVDSLKKGEEQFRKHNFNAALPYVDKAIKLEPKYAWAYYLRACCRHDLNDFNGALADCDAALAIDPTGNPILYFQRGIAKYRLKKMAPALVDFDTAIQKAPAFPGTYLYRAHCRFSQGDKKGALEDCNSLLKLKPNDPGATKMKTQLLADQQKTVKPPP